MEFIDFAVVLSGVMINTTIGALWILAILFLFLNNHEALAMLVFSCGFICKLRREL